MEDTKDINEKIFPRRRERGCLKNLRVTVFLFFVALIAVFLIPMKFELVLISIATITVGTILSTIIHYDRC